MSGEIPGWEPARPGRAWLLLVTPLTPFPAWALGGLASLHLALSSVSPPGDRLGEPGAAQVPGQVLRDLPCQLSPLRAVAQLSSLRRPVLGHVWCPKVYGVVPSRAWVARGRGPTHQPQSSSSRGRSLGAVLEAGGGRSVLGAQAAGSAGWRPPVTVCRLHGFTGGPVTLDPTRGHCSSISSTGAPRLRGSALMPSAN